MNARETDYVVSPSRSSLLVDGEWVHVGYSRENREVLVIAVPANK